MININLLPQELKLKRIQAKHTVSLISVCLVIIFATVILGIIAQSAKETVTAHLGNTQANVDQSNNLQGENKTLVDDALLINDRAQATNDVNKTRAIWSQVLQELSNDAPSDVQFETVTANALKKPNFQLTGNTSSEVEIIKFKDKLESSGFFKNVTFKNSSLNSGQTSGQNLKFTLEFDLAKFASANTSGANQ
jgi:Tfp pilus assembly protein PilN